MKRIYTISFTLNEYTGLHQVLSKVHTVLKNEFDAKIVGNMDYSKVHRKMNIKENDYIIFRNPFKFYNSIVVAHERILLPLLWIIKLLNLGNVKIVYIHHNILVGHKYWSFFPKHIITISEKCIKNLTEYFNIPKKRITKIYNCADDAYYLCEKEKEYTQDDIKILYPAKIYNVKQQLEIVRHLKNRLSSGVHILFAGNGPDFEELKSLTVSDDRFECLGFINDMSGLYKTVDYVMLFSKHEGLPISLIEGAMTATPLICNDVGGNLEIAENGYNAMVTNDWDGLIECLNSLPSISKDEYLRMSRNSRVKYLENFTFDKFKEYYINYFRTLLSE